MVHALADGRVLRQVIRTARGWLEHVRENYLAGYRLARSDEPYLGDELYLSWLKKGARCEMLRVFGNSDYATLRI